MSEKRDPKELAEDIEEAARKFLRDLDADVAEHLQEITFKPDEVRYHYYDDVGDKDTKRIDSFKYDPRAFFGADTDE